MNEVLRTFEFRKIYDASDKREKDFIDNIKNQLQENLNVGKPLKFDWFREKRFENKRLYYLINRLTKKAIFVAFGSKKEQQKIVDHIITNKARYLKNIN